MSPLNKIFISFKGQRRKASGGSAGDRGKGDAALGGGGREVWVRGKGGAGKGRWGLRLSVGFLFWIYFFIFLYNLFRRFRFFF